MALFGVTLGFVESTVFGEALGADSDATACIIGRITAPDLHLQWV